jgi:hypothetical protein
MSRKCLAAAAQMFCVLLSGLQIGCTHTQPGNPQASIDAEEEQRARDGYEANKGEYAPFVGKTRWVKADQELKLCPQPADLKEGCTSLEAQQSFVVDRVVPGFQQMTYVSHTDSQPYCHLTAINGAAGFVRCLDLTWTSTDIDPVVAAADCGRHGGRPRVGSSAKLVIACWGKPNTIKRRETAKGASERYDYGSGRSVLFHNGVAVAIRTER